MDQAQQAEPEAPAPQPRYSAAYTALARLGHVEPRLTLSAADCATLEELASTWLERGVTTDHLTRSLVAGLPEYVHSPRALVQRRLRDKMPPDVPLLSRPPGPPGPAERVRRTMLECTDCRVPGRPEALPDGLCRACREGGTRTDRPPSSTFEATSEAMSEAMSEAVLPAHDVHRRAAQVRSAFASR